MRIGIDVLAARPRIGSGFIYPVQLIKALSEIHSDHEYFVFVSQDNARFFHQRNSRFHSIRCRVDSRRTYLRVAYGHSVLALRAGVRKLDLLHSTGNIAPMLSRVPSVVTIHFLNSFTTPELLPRRSIPYLNRQIRRSVLQARRVITVSNALRDELETILKVPSERTAVIPNGLTAGFFAGLPRDRAISTNVSESNDVRVLSVTNPLPHKNNAAIIAGVIQASANMGRPLQIRIVGDERLRGELDPVVRDLSRRTGQSVDVRYLGFLKQDALVHEYDAAAVFLMPSLVESFGLPALEAMARGCPVVCSDLPALRENCEDVPFYCNPSNIESIADAVVRAVRDTPKLGSRLRRGVALANRFTWRDAALRTVEVYESARP